VFAQSGGFSYSKERKAKTKEIGNQTFRKVYREAISFNMTYAELGIRDKTPLGSKGMARRKRQNEKGRSGISQIFWAASSALESRPNWPQKQWHIHRTVEVPGSPILRGRKPMPSQNQM